MLTAKISVSVKGNPHLDKQTAFALASALTLTAKEAQPAVSKAVRGTFTVRSNWDQPSNIFGIRVKPATKQNLVAIVGTAADWLEKFLKEPQGIVVKLPQGEFIAIPTSNVRRTKRDIIQKAQRPNALRGKRDELLPMKSGKGFILAQRRGKGPRSKLVVLYVLVPRAKIPQKDILFGPTRRVFQNRFAAIYEKQLQKAFATAR